MDDPDDRGPDPDPDDDGLGPWRDFYRGGCLACSCPDAAGVTHGGVTLRLCGLCLPVAQWAALELADPTPRAIVQVCAHYAQHHREHCHG
jgi:hypothetical protein